MWKHPVVTLLSHTYSNVTQADITSNHTPLSHKSCTQQYHQMYITSYQYHTHQCVHYQQSHSHSPVLQCHQCIHHHQSLHFPMHTVQPTRTLPKPMRTFTRNHTPFSRAYCSIIQVKIPSKRSTLPYKQPYHTINADIITNHSPFSCYSISQIQTLPITALSCANSDIINADITHSVVHTVISSMQTYPLSCANSDIINADITHSVVHTATPSMQTYPLSCAHSHIIKCRHYPLSCANSDINADHYPLSCAHSDIINGDIPTLLCTQWYHQCTHTHFPVHTAISSMHTYPLSCAHSHIINAHITNITSNHSTVLRKQSSSRWRVHYRRTLDAHPETEMTASAVQSKCADKQSYTDAS